MSDLPIKSADLAKFDMAVLTIFTLFIGMFAPGASLLTVLRLSNNDLQAGMAVTVFLRLKRWSQRRQARQNDDGAARPSWNRSQMSRCC